jgi:hypothetical protein
MKPKRLLFLSVLVLGLLAIAAVRNSSADEDKKEGTNYKEIDVFSPPGGLHSFDISWVDSASGLYFLADRTTTPDTGRIDVVNAEETDAETGADVEKVETIPGFVGNQGRDLSGPNGVVAIHRRGKLGAGEGNERIEVWAGDGVDLTKGGTTSTVKVIDLDDGCPADRSKCIVDSISTGGNHRADELAYDPSDKIIMIANDADIPHPFVTFISVEDRKVLGKIFYDGVDAPLATNGLEQPVWDPQRHRFYFAVPATDKHPNGEVDEIDAVAEKITRQFLTSCNPAGLALLPGQRLMTSCGDVLSAKTGAVITTVKGVAADEIWFNPGDDRVYFGHEPVFVVDADTYQVLTSIDAGGTHSVAADSENNRVFIPTNAPPASNPTAQTGITVWTADEDQDSNR